MLIQTGYDYGVNKLVQILKRMTDDSNVQNDSSHAKQAFMAGTLGDDEDLDEVHDAMAALLGDDSSEEEPISEDEALACLAALTEHPPPPTPKRS